jgi:hypothetical protein
MAPAMPAGSPLRWALQLLGLRACAAIAGVSCPYCRVLAYQPPTQESVVAITVSPCLP